MVAVESQAPDPVGRIDLKILMLKIAENDFGLVQSLVVAASGVLLESIRMDLMQIATEINGTTRRTVGRWFESHEGPVEKGQMETR